MAQLNITLDQDEILRLLGDSSGDAMRVLLQEAVNAVLKAESDEQIGADRYERTEERADRRNGTRERTLTTRIGDIVLRVPRHRDRPFRSMLIENYRRSEAALVTAMAEMVVNGVSTAKVGKVMEQICGRSFSKQAVSEACRDLDVAVAGFTGRRLDGDYAFVMVDATYLKVREGHRVVSRALMIAIGLTARGIREVIGVSLEDAETAESWTSFLGSLRDRGLSGFRMLTSDSHEGILAALHEVYPGVPWQRCQAHFARNVAEKAPKRLRAGLRAELAEMFNCATVEEARSRRDEIIADYSDLAPKAMECLDAGFDDAMTVMELPEGMRRCTRTSNHLERLNREVKRRTRVVGVFPNAASAARLAGAVLMEESEAWATMRRLYHAPAIRELEASEGALARIATIQRQMAMAA